jgi:hypothetical protein
MRASCSAFVNVSTVPISGRAAPFLTASPIGTRASGVAEPPAIRPLPTSLSKGGRVTIATSNGASPTTFSSTLPTMPYSMISLWPDDLSKRGASSASAARIAPALSTVSSTALACCVCCAFAIISQPL